MKRITFLIVGVLLVLGLVLPGCTTPTPPAEEVVYTFDGDAVNIGIAGEIGHATGDMQYLGASLAQGAINGAGGIVIDGVACNLTLQKVDTKEAADETGASGVAAMEAAVDSVDFFMGGFRTEALEVYREVAMDNEKMFFNCGAATESLQHSVVTDYDKYKYWFKVTPYNEYFLASSVLRLVDFTARQIRAALNMSADANIDACIVAEDLEWSRDEQVPLYEAGLPALHITNLETYLVSSTDPASTVGALADIAANYDPQILIPVYSGTMGVYFAGGVMGYVGPDVLGPMTVGINVYEQLKAPWAANIGHAPGGNETLPYAAWGLILDTWADGMAMTDKTLPFLGAFMTYSGGEYPLYTAVTYDALFVLKTCLEDVGYEEDGVAKAKADDIIAWYEDPANAQQTTTGDAVKYYPQPGTEVGGEPALSSAQVDELYDPSSYGYIYDGADWVMPPHTTHDLVYGPGSATGAGCQWQWDAGASQWKKFGVWPAEIEGADLIDQYGDWNFAYTGVKAFQLAPWVVAHFS